MALAAAGAFVVAIFNADLPGAGHTLHGILHGLGALLFWISFPVAAIDLSSRLRQTERRRVLGIASLALGLLSFVFLVLSYALPPLQAVGGLAERLLLLINLAWVVLVALGLRGPRSSNLR